MKTNLENAVKIVTTEIKNNADFYMSYQANIAMAFKDEYSRYKKKYKNRDDMHEIANKAAKNFLNMWCR